MSTLEPSARKADRIQLQELLGTWYARCRVAETHEMIGQANRWASETEQGTYIKRLQNLGKTIRGFCEHIKAVLDSETEHFSSQAHFDLKGHISPLVSEDRLLTAAWQQFLLQHRFDNEFSAGSVQLRHLVDESKRSEFPNSLAIAQKASGGRKPIKRKAPGTKRAGKAKAPAGAAPARATL